ncbi:hypothetical protein BDV93DRAFT_65544 [Ceratobasidium sp. AG-I]|nr:hypothetical protein BDV93DRAFT_65544 [Ceratobasidium sp. AG-I]
MGGAQDDVPESYDRQLKSSGSVAHLLSSCPTLLMGAPQTNGCECVLDRPIKERNIFIELTHAWVASTIMRPHRLTDLNHRAHIRRVAASCCCTLFRPTWRYHPMDPQYLSLSQRQRHQSIPGQHCSMPYPSGTQGQAGSFDSRNPRLVQDERHCMRVLAVPTRCR